MPLPERTYKHVNTSRNPAIINMEQYLRGGQSARMSPTCSSPIPSSPSSPYFERVKHHDPEEDHGLYQKKSVLAKVKEKARKLRTSLSKKKMDEGNLTPSWGVSLEDEEEEEEEEDPEYLGAPIYESELAPEDYKENARQHPRANPVISEKHVLRNAFKLEVEQDRDMRNSPATSTTPQSAATTTTTTTTNSTHGVPNMTMTEQIAEKLIPAGLKRSDTDHSTSYNAVSRTPSANLPSQASSPSPLASSLSSPTHNSPSSFLTIGGKNINPEGAPMKDYLMNKFESRNYEETHSQVTPETVNHRRGTSNAGVLDKVKGAVNSLLRNEDSSPTEYSSPKQNSPFSYLPHSGKNASPSAKNYFVNNFEAGNDEKAQSQVTSETMDHRRGPSNGGVIEKVKGAVSSLILRNDEPSQKYAVKAPTTSAITNNQEVGQEENRGRILQANY